MKARYKVLGLGLLVSLLGLLAACGGQGTGNGGSGGNGGGGGGGASFQAGIGTTNVQGQGVVGATLILGFNAPQAGPYQIRVRDSSGNPLPLSGNGQTAVDKAGYQRRSLNIEQRQLPPSGTYIVEISNIGQTQIQFNNQSVLPLPQNIQVNASTTQVSISWNPVPGAVGYLVYIAGSNLPGISSPFINQTSLRFTNLNLQPGAYGVQVMALRYNPAATPLQLNGQPDSSLAYNFFMVQ